LKDKTGLGSLDPGTEAGVRGETRNGRWNSKNMTIGNWKDKGQLLVISKKILVIVPLKGE
jgi:hypothetical protein